MQKLLLLQLISILLASTLSAQSSEFNKNLKNLSKKPINHQPGPPAVKQCVPVETPWLYFGSFPYVTKEGVISNAKFIQDIKHDTALLNSLCAWQETTTVLDVTNTVNLQLPVITASENGEKYSVIYEFKKFTNVDSNDLRFEVGVDVRLVANFATIKGAVNLKLSALGAAASAGKISGTISISCFGVSLSKIGAAFATTSSISAETIENILQQVATLKAAIYDPGAVISPYVIAIQSLTDTTQSPNWLKLQGKANLSRSSFKTETK